MLTIALFAMIGAMLHAGPAYWIIFGIWSFFRVTRGLLKFFMALAGK